MNKKFEIIQLQIKESPKFVKEWEKKLSMFCDKMIDLGFDLNSDKTEHVGKFFEDKIVKCPLLNIEIELGLDNEYYFKLDGDNASIGKIVYRMMKRRHICTNKGFLRKFKENAGLGGGQMRLGLFFIPLAFAAISSLLTIAAGAGIVALTNSKKEKDKLIIKPPQNIMDSPIINENHERITRVVYYLENIIDSFENLTITDEENQQNEELLPPLNIQSEGLDNIIDQVNSKPVITSDELVDAFDYERINNDKDEVLRILNNSDHLPALADFLNNRGNRDSFNSDNRAELEQLLDDFTENINNSLLTPIELDELLKLRDIIKKRLESVKGIPKKVKMEKDEEESDGDDYVPFFIVPLWSRDWKETAQNKLDLKKWLRFGDISATPFSIDDFKMFDYEKWIIQTFVTNSSLAYPWDEHSLYGIYDYRVNKEANQGVAHVYFQEI